MPGVDPHMQKQINEVARAMVSKIYQEIVTEEAAKSSDTNDISSFTLKKFYEKNAAATTAAEKGECSEDLELTSGGAAESSMPKREPLQVSSEELDDNTEMEQAKELMRNEWSDSKEEDGKTEPKVTSEDDEPKKK